MIRLEIDYIDEDGEFAITMITAKSINHVSISDDGKGRSAGIPGHEFCNYLLDQTPAQLDPLLLYRITDRDVGKELIVARRVPK